MKRNATIHDIARELNLDASTVSRALNGSKRVTARTKKKVLNAAQRLGYSKNFVASSLRTGKGNTIGVIVPRIQRSFFSGVIHGIEEVLSDEGYHLIICQSNEQYVKEVTAVNVLLNKRVDAVIISVSKETEHLEHLHEILEKGVPLVQFDRIIEDLKTNNVVNDNRLGSFNAVKHLLEQGYQNIYHFGGPQHINVYRDRHQGYKEALERFGVLYDNNKVIQALTENQGLRAIEELITNKTPFDALFCASDFSALGAIKHLKKNKIRIPEDVGVVGFANEPFTEILTPQLTSSDQLKVEMGKAAAKLALEQLNSKNGTTQIPKTISLKPRLIERASSTL